MEPVASGGRTSVVRFVSTILSVLLLLTVAHLTWGAAARAETETASLTGVITASDTQEPIEGVEVGLYSYINEAQTVLAASGTTDSEGVYLIEGVNPRTYVVEFTPPNFDYVDAYLSVFEVTVGDNTLDQVMEKSATVSGTVLGETADGTLAVIPGTRVTVVGVGETYFDGSDDVDEEGNYTITSVPSGTYEVIFNRSQDVQTHLESYLGGALDPEDADKLSLETGEERDGVDATLILGSMISGRITGSDGELQTLAQAEIFRKAEDGSWGRGYSLQGSPDSSGAYTVVGLPPGTYRVGFGYSTDDPVKGYRPEYFDDRSSLEAAESLKLGLHENLVDISGVLEPIGSREASSPPSPPPATAPAGQQLAPTGNAASIGAAFLALAIAAAGASLLIWRRRSSRGNG